MTKDAIKSRLLNFRSREPVEMQTRARVFAQNIKTRRTVRDYSDSPVDRSIIELAIAAARSAPSGANQQPWHFVAISDVETKRRIRDAAEAEERAFYGGRGGDEWLDALAHLGTDADKPFLETAPWLIVLFAQRWGTDDEGARVKNYYVPESVGIACGFLIAALHDAGLATLTHTPAPMKFLTDICGRPDSEKPFVLLVVGHPADGAMVPDIERKSDSETVTWLIETKSRR